MNKLLIAIALGLIVGAGVITAEDHATETVAKIDAERRALTDEVYPAFVMIGGGSGVCISPDGYFITNHHVWNDAAAPAVSAVKMAGNDHQFTADAVGADPRGDIVLGKIRLEEGHTAPYCKLGDSEKVRIGDLCLSVGNPFLLSGTGSEPTVTWGTVTATNRFQGGYNDSIQIDTAINPGNSGGPSFNVDGEIIGINGRNISSHRFRFNTGAGYAIPSNQIKNFLDTMKAQEGGALVVRHGIIGGLQLDFSSQDGARVRRVSDNTEASDAGFEAGDVITKVDGKDSFNGFRFYGIIGAKPRGSSFNFTVERDGETIELAAKNNVPSESGQFGNVPRSDDKARGGGGRGLFSGINPFALPDMKSNIGFLGSYNEDREVGGYVITEIKVGSPLIDAGLQEDDILTHVNGRHIQFFADLHDILIATEPGSVVTITYKRHGQTFETIATTIEPS